MIIGKDINPQRKIFYLGGVVLDTLKSTSNEEISFFDLFGRVNNKEKISLSLFTLTLDWLFLLDAVSYSKGGLKKCF
jgi:hypothetical protein